jgi:hypothetical protein
MTIIKDWVTIIGFGFTCIGVIILTYKSFADPDKKADKDLTVFDAKCAAKHSRLDEIIKEIKEAIKGINYTFAHFKENEFRHIEEEMRRMSDTQTEIMTIFKERDKK